MNNAFFRKHAFNIKIIAFVKMNSENEELCEWATKTINAQRASTRECENFLGAVTEMAKWSLDDTVKYLSDWSDKARLTHAMSFDHLQESTLITVKSD
jgi:hypothetical protein